MDMTRLASYSTVNKVREIRLTDPLLASSLSGRRRRRGEVLQKAGEKSLHGFPAEVKVRREGGGALGFVPLMGSAINA